jgi:hypothetical protein
MGYIHLPRNHGSFRSEIASVFSGYCCITAHVNEAESPRRSSSAKRLAIPDLERL